MSVKFDLEGLFQDLKSIDYAALYDYFKRNHRQRLFVKKVDEEGSLLLIHNNLEKTSHTDLYHECRSVVIDVKDGTQPKIVSYSHDNVLYATPEAFGPMPGDVLEESFEGTMVSVFHHDGAWHFTSTRCPKIEQSFFFRRDKSHGEMLDEALRELFPEAADVRAALTDRLDPSRCYYFVIVHHENQYVVDYTTTFGEGYRKLVHIITRDKETQSELEDRLDVSGLVYARRFGEWEEAKGWLAGDEASMEGVIVKRLDPRTNKNTLIKIPTAAYTRLRMEKPNYANVWVSCIEVFQRNNPKYRPDDFLKKHFPQSQLRDASGKTYDVTGVLYYIMKMLAQELFVIYHHFTKFDPATGRYTKINGDLYSRAFSGSALRTFRNQVQRLQNYQHKHLGANFRLTDMVEHLRTYTSPEDIYHLMKEHHTIATDVKELHAILKDKIGDLGRMDSFVNIYIHA
jgi:hypothetical protein